MIEFAFLLLLALTRIYTKYIHTFFYGISIMLVSRAFYGYLWYLRDIWVFRFGVLFFHGLLCEGGLILYIPYFLCRVDEVFVRLF